MAWSTFLGVVIGIYALYYVLNLLYDLSFSRKRKTAAGGGIHYNMRDLMGEEESPEEVHEEFEEEADDYLEEEDFEQESEEAFEEETISANPAERMTAAAPALRVEGQGIPLDEFLKEAKTYSGSIF
jgi:hypothetical protein